MEKVSYAKIVIAVAMGLVSVSSLDAMHSKKFRKKYSRKAHFKHHHNLKKNAGLTHKKNTYKLEKKRIKETAKRVALQLSNGKKLILPLFFATLIARAAASNVFEQNCEKEYKECFVLESEYSEAEGRWVTIKKHPLSLPCPEASFGWDYYAHGNQQNKRNVTVCLQDSPKSEVVTATVCAALGTLASIVAAILVYELVAHCKKQYEGSCYSELCKYLFGLCMRLNCLGAQRIGDVEEVGEEGDKPVAEEIVDKEAEEIIKKYVDMDNEASV